jgi:hypothetical protein
MKVNVTLLALSRIMNASLSGFTSSELGVLPSGNILRISEIKVGAIVVDAVRASGVGRDDEGQVDQSMPFTS